jgi:mannose-6-phosphate isomerase-like protein (cupin superfamily)
MDASQICSVQRAPSPNAEVATICFAIRRDHFGRQRRGGIGERDRLGPRHNVAVCHGFLGRDRYGLGRLHARMPSMRGLPGNSLPSEPSSVDSFRLRLPLRGKYHEKRPTELPAGLPPIRVERQIVGRRHGVGCWRQGGGSHNLHKGADQWLHVVDGSGVAIINGPRTRLKAGTIVLIEAGDRHEIRNTGRTLLKTVSVLVPPAYREIRSPTRQSSLVLGCLEDLQAMHYRQFR